MIRLTEVRLDDEARELVDQVLRSGHLAQGPVVAAFEEAFAEIAGTKYAVATSSGTTALVLALESMSLGPGDEVITSAFTFAATLNAILEVGATARIVDIGLDDFALDLDELEAAISPRTRAILPVHLYGCPANMPEIHRIASRAGVAIIEDAAQAHGATVEGRPVGSWGVGCFSFYATKNITTGEGGMITTDDPEVATRARVLRNQGMRARYQYEVPGHNYRMTDVQAAIGIAQLRKLRDWTTKRQRNAESLSGLLDPIEQIRIPQIPAGRTHVFHQYTVLVDTEASVTRDGLAASLDQRGIESGIYYPRPVHDYPCYQEDPRVVVGPVPNAHLAASQVLSMPIHQWLQPADVAAIADAVAAIVKP